MNRQRPHAWMIVYPSKRQFWPLEPDPADVEIDLPPSTWSDTIGLLTPSMSSAINVESCVRRESPLRMA